MTVWDPGIYLRYAAERDRPFWDLVARVPLDAPARVVDLGCGPGPLTAGLAERWPAAEVVGVDSSSEMIAEARARTGSRLRFIEADVREWRPEGGLDLLISNALLQWVPGHVDLFPRWLAALAPGGVFAFSVPGNFDAPSHALLYELATGSRWAAKLPAVRAPGGVLDPAGYFDALAGLGATVDAWETTYLHVLSGPDPVFRWVSGTALRPYLGQLSGLDVEAFSAEYRQLLAEAYPPRADGTVLLPFRRIFAVACTATR